MSNMQLGNEVALEVLALLVPDTVSLHYDFPQGDGLTAELTLDGNYTRMPADYSLVNDKVTLGSDVIINVTNGSIVKYIGYWKGTKYLGSAPTIVSIFGNNGTYMLKAGSTIDA